MGEPSDERETLKEREKCPHCGSEYLETRNTSLSGDPLFTDVYCSRCGAFVRTWNSV